MLYKTRRLQKELLDDHRTLVPPDPIPNSEVKRRIADGSVGFPHVRVGHCQAPNTKHPDLLRRSGFFYAYKPFSPHTGNVRELNSIGILNALGFNSVPLNAIQCKLNSTWC